MVFRVAVVVLVLAIKLLSCAKPLVFSVAPNTLLLLISAFTVAVPALCMVVLLVKLLTNAAPVEFSVAVVMLLLATMLFRVA